MKKHSSGRLAAAFFLSFCIVVSNSCKLLKGIASTSNKAYSLNDSKIYLSQIEAINVFEDDETLLTEEEFLRLRNSSYKPCTYQFDGDKNDLYNIIILNSNNYLQEHRNYKSVLDIDNDKIREYVIKTIKDILDRNLQEKRNDNIHKLVNLKVVIGSLEEDTLGEYRSSENLVVLDINHILKDGFTKDDVYMNLYDVINHEFNHAFQGSCGDILSNEVSFLVEASAESYNYNVLKTSYVPSNKDFKYGYTYGEERKYESKLFLLSLLDNTKSIQMYYDAIDRGSFEELFSFLNLSDKKAKDELIQGLWLVDGIMLRNDYWSRVIKSNDYRSFDDYNINELLKNQVHGSFESFILKYSVKNLMKYNLQGRNLSLEDNLILYHFILLNVLDSVSYNNYNYLTCEVSYTFYKEFYNNYLRIETLFFDFLSNYYGVASEDVKTFYEDLDKDEIVNSIMSYLEYGTCRNENIKRLIDKYPKIGIVMKSGIVLSNFNYDNIKSIKDRQYNMSGIKLVLK